MDTNSYVLVIDSGIGGLSILNELRKNKNKLNFIYYSDNAYAPLGNKSKQFISRRLIDIVERFINVYNIEIIVIACNTMTSCGIDLARSVYKKIIFIGTNPPIKPALKSNKNNILVLCTKATKRHTKILKNNNKNIIIKQDKKLAKKIDDNKNNLNIIKPYLTKILKNNLQSDAVVLGCTHYYFVKNIIKQIIPSSTLYCSTDGINKRFNSLINKNIIGENVVLYFSS